ncbi:MAG TPA: 50S ribosomal protein L4 [Planctomycetes bacterium]|nr:50S ribosomal protein L4 [Planctomycetota bacterium]
MQVKSYQAGSAGEVEIDDRPFRDKSGKSRVLYRTLKDAVVMHQANQRQGTASTKTRGKVKGTNKKPYRQKGTGRARAGDRKSPIWRGGGTVFGPLPRDYSYHMPAKARRLATRTALLGKMQDGEVVIADLGGFTEPSARSARKILSDLGSPRRALVVLAEPKEMVWKSFRNFPGVTVRCAKDLCAYDVVAGGLLIVEAAAMDALAARVGGANSEGGDA